MHKITRVLSWIALGLISLLVVGFGLVSIQPKTGLRVMAGLSSTVNASADTIQPPEGVPIGGPFRLKDEHGRELTDAEYRGRWMLVFFGYSNCPDECPLTLQKMAAALKGLGPLADRVAPLFITVDPARDTSSRLASYLANFDPRIIGLTGSSQQIAKVSSAYRVYYSTADHEASGADLVSHSTFLYLIDPRGKLSALFSQDITADRLAAALRGRMPEKLGSSAPHPATELSAICVPSINIPTHAGLVTPCTT